MLRLVAVAAVSAAALAVSAPAFAADLPAYEPSPAYAAPAPSSNWSGGYIGGQAGYSWGRSTNRNAPNTKPEGGLVGAYAGYDHQFDGSPVVVGVDTDINYNNSKDRAGRVRNDLNWSGATRGRIGYAMDNVMVYGAAGVAYGDQKVRSRGDSDSKTAVGWTAGGGVEAKITENVVARGEYRYSDYGSDRYSTGARSVKSDLTESRVTGGVALKFSAW